MDLDCFVGVLWMKERACCGAVCLMEHNRDHDDVTGNRQVTTADKTNGNLMGIITAPSATSQPERWIVGKCKVFSKCWGLPWAEMRPDASSEPARSWSPEPAEEDRQSQQTCHHCEELRQQTGARQKAQWCLTIHRVVDECSDASDKKTSGTRANGLATVRFLMGKPPQDSFRCST